MFSTSSTIAYIAFSASLIYVACGAQGEEISAYKAIGNCIQEGRNGIGNDIHQNGGHVKNEAAKVEEFCIFFRAFVPCILRANHNLSASKPIKVVIAYEWQQMVLAEKAGLCSNFPFGNMMRKIALDAGLAENKEKFVNIEGDNYERCAGDVMRKCIIHCETSMEDRAYKGWMYVVKDYVECLKKEADRPEDGCHADIMKHFIGNFEAYLNFLEKEGNEKLAKMLKEIAPPV